MKRKKTGRDMKKKCNKKESTEIGKHLHLEYKTRKCNSKWIRSGNNCKKFNKLRLLRAEPLLKISGNIF